MSEDEVRDKTRILADGPAVTDPMAGGVDLGDVGRDVVEKQVAKRVVVVVTPRKVASWDHRRMSALPGAGG